MVLAVLNVDEAAAVLWLPLTLAAPPDHCVVAGLSVKTLGSTMARVRKVTQLPPYLPS